MFKTFFTTAFYLAISMTLTTACAGETEEKTAAPDSPASTETAVTDTTAKVDETTGEKVSVMDTPVNFSTPEDIEKSFLLIREQAGENEVKNLKAALDYVKTYDLSMGYDIEKVYKKMNGRTPNQIIAKIKR